MSVCFFVPAEQAGTSAGSEENEVETVEEIPAENIQNTLQAFWNKVNEDMKKINAEDFKTQVLPLARIKKIMKLDEEVKMISAEAPVLFAKAAEIFIHELTLRAWSHTEDNKRRTLQRYFVKAYITISTSPLAAQRHRNGDIQVGPVRLPDRHRPSPRGEAGAGAARRAAARRRRARHGTAASDYYDSAAVRDTTHRADCTAAAAAAVQRLGLEPARAAAAGAGGRGRDPVNAGSVEHDPSSSSEQPQPTHHHPGAAAGAAVAADHPGVVAGAAPASPDLPDAGLLRAGGVLALRVT